MARYISVAALTLFMCVHISGQHLHMISRIDKAIERSCNCLKKIPTASSDELWYLYRAQGHLNNPQYDLMVEQLRIRSKSDQMGTLINPLENVKSFQPKGPKPWQDLLKLMHESLNCRQGGVPSQDLQDFLEEEHSGYVLTHQILAIHWSKSVGCDVPDSWIKLEKLLADRVLKELLEPDEFNDLLAERLLVLGLAEKNNSLVLSRMETLLEAQKPDGCWTSPRENITMQFREYNLESKSAIIPFSHTSTLAIGALALYRNILLKPDLIDP